MKTTLIVLVVFAAYVATVLGLGWFTGSWLVGFGIAVCLAATMYAIHWAIRRYKGPLVVIFGGN